jgi:hypothetical protein
MRTACALAILLFFGPSCATVNDMAAKPSGGHGASDDEAIIMVAGVMIINFCVIYASVEQSRHK